MNDQDLERFFASDRDRISLDFLAWIADCERSSAGTEQRRLWELGSKLMALREGLTPVSMEDLELAQLLSSQCSNVPAEVPGPRSLTPTVHQTASLGISMDGMVLLEKQATALEATVGASRATALTEVLGRKIVLNSGQEMVAFGEANAAERILGVLVEVDDREERISMLQDACTPPQEYSDETAAAVDSQEEEEVYTTPLQLLQAVDLWLQRIAKGTNNVSRSGLESNELKQVLTELRDDILGAWDASSEEDC